MNLFVKKFLVAGIVLQLAALVLPAQTAVNLGNLPLWFEANQGQAEATSQFIARGRGSEFLISPAGAEIILHQAGGKIAAARMQFVGANPSAEISGAAPMTGKISYLIGDDSARWQSGVPTFGQVRVEKIYPGVNVVYYGNQNQLEYDFDLAAGVRPETIAIHFSGAEKISVNGQGELIVALDGGKVIQHEAVAYQTFGGVRHDIKVGYQLLDAHTVAFAVGHYDSSLPLVIDPVLGFATFFGGNNTDIAWAVAYGANDDSVYIAGQTLSTLVSNNIPFATPGAFQTTFQGGAADGDAFVAKFDSSGTNLIYCTYFGGKGDDAVYALAVGANGNAYVAGSTLSTNFPIKNPVIYQTFNGSNLTGPFDKLFNHIPSDAFVAELETNGASLVYSTYLGGNSSEAAFGLALDPAGDAFVTGTTYSTNFPVTPDAYQTNFASVNNLYVGCNAFISEIHAGGNTLNYSSYLGGTNVDVGYAISFNNGYLAVAGSTCSSNFPTTNYLNPATANYNYDGHVLNSRTNNINNNLHIAGYTNDAFVVLFQASGSTLTPPLYSTLLGGTNNDIAYGVAVDPLGNAYVVGGTTSTNFPNTTNIGQVKLSSYLRTNNVNNVLVTNAFLTQITWNGANPAIGYSQIFGGVGNDSARAVTLDAAGDVFIIGSTTSLTNYAATANLFGSLDRTNSGDSDIFVTAFNPGLSALLYSADLGGLKDDFGYGIAVDPAGNAYITGQTSSGMSFPSFNALRPVRDGDNDGFLMKILLNANPPPLTITSAGTNVLVSWTPVPMEEFVTNSLGLATGTNLLSTNWIAVNKLPVFTNNAYIYTFNPTNRMRFFRFRKF